MKNIYGLTLNKLETYLVNVGMKKFNASQIFDWLYKKRVTDFSEMSNLSKNLRDKLNSEFEIKKLEIVAKQESKDVIKYLFNLYDDNKIEAVLMKHDYGISLCVSSQVGCNMGCKFCESGRLKKVRNLETYEMVLQVLQIEEYIGSRISHVVIMGIGEPFDNYDNVLDFIKIINSGKALDIGSRHITVSTCGLVEKIEKFSMENLQVNLAISLHAPNDKIRNELMPINKVYNIEKLIDAVKKYIKKTNRRVTFEYILLDSINDTKDNALELASLLRGINCYVNLIPYNETENIGYFRTKSDKILKFYDILKKKNINVTIRKEFGTDIDAACGQLRAKLDK